MSEKVKQVIKKALKKIEERTFDEDTIRTLLITSREFITRDGLIKELAHFIAHPKRDKGIFYKRLNSRYAKFTLVSSQLKNANRENINTEEGLSELMLGGVSVDKIEAKLFDILYFDGLDDLPEIHLMKHTGFTKNEVKEFLSSSYVKQNNYYYIRTYKTEYLLRALRQLPKSNNPVTEIYTTKMLSEVESSVKKLKATMDKIQKVIRGAIYFNSVFDTQAFKKEISDAISSILNQFNIDKKYIKCIDEQSDNILLCVMTLLHDCKFVFYDKNEANTFLCFYLDSNFKEKQKANDNLADDIYQNGVIGLYTSDKDVMAFPLFVSELPIKNYVSFEDYMAFKNHSTIMKVDLTTASRINGRLQLTRDETMD